MNGQKAIPFMRADERFGHKNEYGTLDILGSSWYHAAVELHTPAVLSYLERRRPMKADQSAFKKQQKQSKPFLRFRTGDERNLHLRKQVPKRLRVVQSVTAGHVRGGYSFH
jgi:hypothetical protein